MRGGNLSGCFERLSPLLILPQGASVTIRSDKCHLKTLCSWIKSCCLRGDQKWFGSSCLHAAFALKSHCSSGKIGVLNFRTNYDSVGRKLNTRDDAACIKWHRLVCAGCVYWNSNGKTVRFLLSKTTFSQQNAKFSLTHLLLSEQFTINYSEIWDLIY